MAKKVGSIFLVCCATLLNACNPVVQENHEVTNLNIRVFFTPSTECERNIVQEIEKAHKIRAAVYSITNQSIYNALVKAHNRGVDIKIVTDRTQSKGKGSLVGNLKKAGIPVLTNHKHKIEHNKFAVFDDSMVVTGSYNWTTNASKYNSENCVFFDQMADKYSHRFEYLWNMYQ